MIVVMFLLSIIAQWFNLMHLYMQWCNRKLRFRRWWVKRHITNEMRDLFGAYQTLFIYFAQNDHEEFYNMTRMTPHQFETLYGLIRHRLIKRSKRRPLSKRLRLIITLK